MPMRLYYREINLPVVLFHSRALVSSLILEFAQLHGAYILGSNSEPGFGLHTAFKAGKTVNDIDIVGATLWRPHSKAPDMLVDVHTIVRPASGKSWEYTDVTVPLPERMYAVMALYVSSRLKCTDFFRMQEELYKDTECI